MSAESEQLKLSTVPEAEVKFKIISDRDVMNVVNADSSEVLIEISGYDLQINFNMEYLKSVEDIDAACNGVAQLFRDTIMDKLLEYRKQK
ncbi:hypothetical protein [Phocaeicola plebeius]|jgi:hypothetical protein|uniref:hypothetical protein n=1 Tax=Phocaeicola plebeius TaxID=310297 RepID=UPI003AB38595